MTDSLNDKIKKLIAKYNSIQGSLLSMGKRLTALEEKPIEAPDNELLTKIGVYLGFIKAIREETDEKEEEVEEVPEILETKIDSLKPEDEIDPEVLDSLDEIIEAE